MKRHLIALMFIAVPAPVLAQEPSPAVVATPAPADPAKLAVASRIAGALLPDGTYRTMMRGTFDKMMSSMVDQMGDLPLREILLAAGMQDKDVPMIQPGAMKEVMAIVDPVYRQRMDLGMKAMISSMTDMMSKYEPAQREGLAEAYARRFDATDRKSVV